MKRMIHIATIGLDPPTGAIQTMKNLLGNGTGKPVRDILAKALRGEATKVQVVNSAKATVDSVVYAAYTPERYKRTRAFRDAIVWMPTPKSERADPKAASMMLTVKYRATGYRPNMERPKTKPHGTQAKLGGGGTYPKFFLPQFQPSFLIRAGVPAVRDFFAVWKTTIPPIVINRVRWSIHRYFQAAKAGM